MRFGLFIPRAGASTSPVSTPRDHWSTMHARRASPTTATWESIWVYDHFHTVPDPTEEATHEAWSLMAAFAASTSRVRLGQMCTCMAYRNPAYLAKVAATVDAISGGRTERHRRGLVRARVARVRLRLPLAPHERLAALDEGVQIMQEMWAKGFASFAASTTRSTAPACSLCPCRTAGSRCGSRAAREEDPEARRAVRPVRERRRHARGIRPQVGAVLEQHRDLGRDFGEITRSANYNVVIGETQAQVDDKIARIGDHYRATVPGRADERWSSSAPDRWSAPLSRWSRSSPSCRAWA